MKKEDALKGLLKERDALRQIEGVFSPTYISEHMQRLAQYVSIMEEKIGQDEERLDKKEADLFAKYIKQGKSVNAAQNTIKYELAAERAEISKINKLISTSWKHIGVAQSRIKHLIAEANNQV